MGAERAAARLGLALAILAAPPAALVAQDSSAVEVRLTLKESHARRTRGMLQYRLVGQRIIPDLEFRVAVTPWKPQWRDRVRFRAFLLNEHDDTLRVTGSPDRSPGRTAHAFPPGGQWVIWPWARLRPRLCGREHVVKILVLATGLGASAHSDEFILEGKTDVCRTDN